MASFMYSNVVSYSDGVPGEGRGIPYFYLTTLDPSARDALEDERTSFTLSEFPLGTCGEIDPENPTCAKLTLRASLGTLISHGIFIFPREISSFSLGKMKIPWEISVPKLALNGKVLKITSMIR
jgi:hypothetical protein